MAGMTTVLKEFSNNGNSRTSTYTGHAAVAPRLVIEKRLIPTSQNGSPEYSVKVVSSTTDADSKVLTAKVMFEAIVRYPLLGNSADVTAALAVFRDVIAGDEFGQSVTSQNWL